MRNLMKRVPDLGIWALDRSMKTCSYRSTWCDKHCYNFKFEKLYPGVVQKYAVWEENWKNLEPESFGADLARKRTGNRKRFRICTKGEPFTKATYKQDIARVLRLALATPDVTFWVPTRAWTDPEVAGHIERILINIKNVRIMASVDISATDKEWRRIISLGWSTLFVGDDDRKTDPFGNKLFKCPKTFFHKKGNCATCKAGCFSKKQVHVHLKQH